jgi:hypothetical protein
MYFKLNILVVLTNPGYSFLIIEEYFTDAIYYYTIYISVHGINSKIKYAHSHRQFLAGGIVTLDLHFTINYIITTTR